jgi:hypothetical protein
MTSEPSVDPRNVSQVSLRFPSFCPVEPFRPQYAPVRTLVSRHTSSRSARESVIGQECDIFVVVHFHHVHSD